MDMIPEGLKNSRKGADVRLGDRGNDRDEVGGLKSNSGLQPFNSPGGRNPSLERLQS
jgi:hypothetical protein